MSKEKCDNLLMHTETLGLLSNRTYDQTCTMMVQVAIL